MHFLVSRERCTVFIITVTESDITITEKSLPQSIKVFLVQKGCIKFHCAKQNLHVLMQNYFPVLNGKPGDKCNHYYIKSSLIQTLYEISYFSHSILDTKCPVH